MKRIEADADPATRNPFGVVDVSDPFDAAVMEFGRSAGIGASSDDENAEAWSGAAGPRRDQTIEGRWRSRWNGGADPTIPGDKAELWKPGDAEARTAGQAVFILFDWDDGRRGGLIEARREGDQRLVGKYINLADPRLASPWAGLIVDSGRIDGRWSGGRLDFRR